MKSDPRTKSAIKIASFKLYYVSLIYSIRPMRNSCSIIALLLTTFCSHSQQILTEINAVRNESLRLDAGAFGDSLLLIQREYQKTKSIQWISATGKVRPTLLNDVDTRNLIGIEAGLDRFARYYFLESGKKSAEVKCLFVNEKTDSIFWQNEALEIPGAFVGSFFREGLNIISIVPNSHILRVLHLDGLTLKNEKSFGIGNFFSGSARGQVGFFSDDKPMTPGDAVAPVKILLTDSLLMIMKDDSYDPATNVAQPILKTTVQQLNLYTGSNTNKFYPQNVRGFIYSMIFGKQLYRIVKEQKQQPILQVLDLKTGEVILSQDLAPLVNDPETFIYNVDEEKHTITKNEVKPLMKILNYLTVESVGSKIVVRIGRRVPARNTFVPIIAPLGPVVALASLATNLALLSMQGGPSFDSYFYLKGSPETGFRFSADSGVISQTISNQELADAAAGIKYANSMHIPARGFTYALYIERKSNKIQVKTYK